MSNGGATCAQLLVRPSTRPEESPAGELANTGAADDLDYSRHYRKWHDETDEHFRAMGRVDFRAVAPFLPRDKSAAILDLGCGMGFAIGGLQAEGYLDVMGIDSDRSQVEGAVRRGLKVDLVPGPDTVANLLSRPFTYDLVYALDVFEHVPRDAVMPLLRAVRAALKPGGKFVCRVPNCNSTIASRWRYDDWTHESQFGASSLDFVLYNAGFQNISVSAEPDIKLPKRPSIFLVRWILRRILRGLKFLAVFSEIGIKEARATPLSPNIWGAGSA
jgi:SAM-dependent methyltransferase